MDGVEKTFISLVFFFSFFRFLLTFTLRGVRDRSMPSVFGGTMRIEAERRKLFFINKGRGGPCALHCVAPCCVMLCCVVFVCHVAMAGGGRAMVLLLLRCYRQLCPAEGQGGGGRRQGGKRPGVGEQGPGKTVFFFPSLLFFFSCPKKRNGMTACNA